METLASATAGLPPGALVAAGCVVATVLLAAAVRGGTVAGAGFGAYVRLGRWKNALLAPYYRATKQYPVAVTCQIPFFRSVGEIYSWVFGYKEDGVFVEVGAYDGESFSNTSTLGDIGWTGHYLEPIPKYADMCRQRHAGNARVAVHDVCIGGKDGADVSLSTAGPFSSAVEDEIKTIQGSKLNSALVALGWAHDSAVQTVKTKTTSLNTFFQRTKGLSQPGVVDVMIVDVEGMEWSIFQTFRTAHFKPKLVIVEIQELQRKYLDNARAQADAAALYKHFADAGYSILYKDAVNTVFLHKECRCVGGE